MVCKARVLTSSTLRGTLRTRGSEDLRFGGQTLPVLGSGSDDSDNADDAVQSALGLAMDHSSNMSVMTADSSTELMEDLYRKLKQAEDVGAEAGGV